MQFTLVLPEGNNLGILISIRRPSLSSCSLPVLEEKQFKELNFKVSELIVKPSDGGLLVRTSGLLGMSSVMGRGIVLSTKRNLLISP